MIFDFGKPKVNNAAPYVSRQCAAMFFAMDARLMDEPRAVDSGYCLDAPEYLPIGGGACPGLPAWVERQQ